MPIYSSGGLTSGPVTVDAATGGLIFSGGVAPHVQMIETSDLAAPAANTGRLYLRDNGAGKTQLVIRFPTGVVQVIATEP